MSLALPALMLILFGWALTLDVDRIPLRVLDHSRSSESRDLISRFEGSTYFDYQGTVDEFTEIESGIDKNETMIGLVISSDFAEQLKRGGEADVQIIVDGSDSNTASIALGYARVIFTEFRQHILGRRIARSSGWAVSRPVDLRLRIWYNPEMKSRNYIIPGLVAVILMIIASLLTSLTIAREWEMGTMEQLLATPLLPAELILGKIAAYFVLGLVDTVIALGLGTVIFEVPMRGSVLLLAGSCFIFLFGALCWGIFLSASVRSQLLAFQMGMVTSFLPAFLLSGFIFAIQSMPVPVQIVTYAVPARYFVSVLQGILLKGVGLPVLLVEILFLIAFAVAVFIATSRKLKRKVA